MAVLRHNKSNREEFMNIRYIRKASLVSKLLQHVGIAPKLYLRLEDLPDLNWPAITSALEQEEKRVAESVASGETQPTMQMQTSRWDVPQRERRKLACFDSYIF